MNLQQLVKKADESLGRIAIPVQIAALRSLETAQGKPYLEAELADDSAKHKVKFWSDSQAFGILDSDPQSTGKAFLLEATFFNNTYGLNLRDPTLRLLDDHEQTAFYAGSQERVDLVQKEYDFLLGVFSSMSEQRLAAVCTSLLKDHEKKWKRAAGARSNHHARRGGLIEHTTQMLRCALALAPLYPDISPELLYAGVLCHDIGKLWENDYPERGFDVQLNAFGELLGHITIGVEVVNLAWKKKSQELPDLFLNRETGTPSDKLRDHLLHLIVSHHGTRDFGSPVTPRTPEAWMLHHIDNLDAKMEMLHCAYDEKSLVAPGLHDRRFPLEGYPAEPLRMFPQSQADHSQ